MAVKLLQREALTFDDVLIAPRRSSIHSRQEVSLRSRLVGDIYLDLPIIAANMDTVSELAMATVMHALGGLAVIHRFITDPIEHARMVSQTPGSRVIAIGVKASDLTKVELVQDLHGVLIDVAHGHHDRVMEMIQAIRERHPKLWVIAGNVATAEGAWDLLEAGAHAIKVGVGPGAVCTTRIVTGCGVPQLTAIIEVRNALDRWWDIETRRKNPRMKQPPTLIADGGLRNSGDMMKALAAGADALMIGSLLAGTEEAPGEVIERDGSKFKLYRGMASAGAQQVVGSNRTPEGVSTLVPYKGSVVPIIKELEGGIRSGMSYCNSASIDDLHSQTIEMVRVSATSLRESMPHAVFGTNNVKVTTNAEQLV